MNYVAMVIRKGPRTVTFETLPTLRHFYTSMLVASMLFIGCAPESSGGFSYLSGQSTLDVAESTPHQATLTLGVIAEFHEAQLPGVRVPLANWKLPLTVQLLNQEDFPQLSLAGLGDAAVVLPLIGQATTDSNLGAKSLDALTDASTTPWVDQLSHNDVLCQEDLEALKQTASSLHITTSTRDQTLTVSFRGILNHPRWTTYGALRVWNPEITTFSNGQVPAPIMSAEFLGDNAQNSYERIAQLYQGQSDQMTTCLSSVPPVNLVVQGALVFTLSNQTPPEAAADNQETPANTNTPSETPLGEEPVTADVWGGKCTYGQFACNPDFPTVVFQCARPHAAETGAHHAINAMPGINPNVIWNAFACSTGDQANDGVHPLCLNDPSRDNHAVCRDLVAVD